MWPSHEGTALARLPFQRALTDKSKEQHQEPLGLLIESVPGALNLSLHPLVFGGPGGNSRDDLGILPGRGRDLRPSLGTTWGQGLAIAVPGQWVKPICVRAAVAALLPPPWPSGFVAAWWAPVSL